jgi:putative flippase GtrA
MIAGRLRQLIAFYWNGVFLKFLLAGGLAAFANFASRIAVQPLVGFKVALVIAFFVGLTVAFVLNRAFVFPASGKPLRQEMSWFLLFNLIAFPIIIGGSVLLRDYVFGHVLPPALAEAAAHGVAIMIPVVFNFAAHQLVTFARSKGA